MSSFLKCLGFGGALVGMGWVMVFWAEATGPCAEVRATGLQSTGESAGQLKVATFCADMTPALGKPIYPSYKPLEVIEEPLLAKGIVLLAGEKRYVLCAVDFCVLANSSYELFREKLAKAVGTSADCVAVHCVHQHTAPHIDGDAQRLLEKYPDPPRYVDFEFLMEVTDRLAQAAKEALSRLEPFDRVGLGQAKVQQVASNRRILRDGKIVGRMSSCKDPALQAEPEGQIDPYLKTISLARGEKVLVRLHYYATHPQSFYNDPRASSDVPGFARQRLEKKEGVFQIYFTGCAGDVAMGKYNDGSREARDALTDRLYRAMEDSIAATRWEPAGKIEWKTLPVKLPARTDRLMEQSRRNLEDPKAPMLTRIYAACRVAYAQRADRPIDISLVQIGPAWILHLPGECMIEFQLYAQSLVPDRFLAVAAYGDDGTSYICTENSYKEGGYEPSASNLAPEAERLLKQAIRTLLGVPAEKDE
ncbi:MAG: hypothetical protein RMI90_10095 [Thermoguttaceae bacterium]|nr:hypothetical protein [Thermoguttaceae bacterium]